jgi:hypothetical protein
MLFMSLYYWSEHGTGIWILVEVLEELTRVFYKDRNTDLVDLVFNSIPLIVQ